MKATQFILKIVALCLAVAAVTCAVIAHWDKISDCFCGIKDTLEEKRSRPAEYDDYADWD